MGRRRRRRLGGLRVIASDDDDSTTEATNGCERFRVVTSSREFELEFYPDMSFVAVSRSGPAGREEVAEESVLAPEELTELLATAGA